MLRGNAVLDALRPVYADVLPVTRGAARLDRIPTRRVGTRKLGPIRFARFQEARFSFVLLHNRFMTYCF